MKALDRIQQCQPLEGLGREWKLVELPDSAKNTDSIFEPQRTIVYSTGITLWSMAAQTLHRGFLYDWKGGVGNE